MLDRHENSVDEDETDDEPIEEGGLHNVTHLYSAGKVFTTLTTLPTHLIKRIFNFTLLTRPF